MKKLISVLASLSIFLSVFCINAYASNTITLGIDKNNIGESIDQLKYGICLGNELGEIDGGLCSNLIANNSFEDEEKYWEFNNIKPTYSSTNPISKNNPSYESLEVKGKGIIKNLGFGGDGSIHFDEGVTYNFACYIKNINFTGEIYAYLNSNGNDNSITQLSSSSISKSSWTEVGCELTALKTDEGCLGIVFEGEGTIELDYVTLMPKSSYGSDSDEWRYSTINNDCFNALQCLSPSFIEYALPCSWDTTIGALAEREQKNSSNIFGIHELFQLCKDLNTSAIPCIDTSKIKSDSAEFLNYKQSALNLIEYANADPLTSYYGALRSANGSEHPFNLKYIEVIGDDGYNEIKKAVESKYKGIKVLSEGDINRVNSSDEKAKGLAKYTISTAILDEIKGTSDDKPFMFSNAISNYDIGDTLGLINFNKNDFAFIPEYYAQMILANNLGDKRIAPSIALDNDSVDFYSSVSVDESKQAIYVSIINPSSAKNVSINLDNFDAITYASIQSISSGWKSASNLVGKQRIAPKEKELKPNENTLSVKLDSNSVNVIRICYGEATGEELYQLPATLNLKAKHYVPAVIIAIIVALCISIPIGGFFGFMIFKKSISKKKPTRKKEEDIND